MSYRTDKTWVYSLFGRYIHLWQISDSASTDTIDGHRIKLPSSSFKKQLIYPDEDISNGLRIEYTSSLEPFIAESLEGTSGIISGTTIRFLDNGSSPDNIIDSGNGFTAAGFEATDKIRVIGSSSNDGDYELTALGAPGTMTVAANLLTTEAAGESITIYQIPKAVEDANVDETSHVNLSRMLCMAVIDYVKAQIKEGQGDLQGKEYCMREFWKKVADNESNKRRISINFPSSTFAVR